MQSTLGKNGLETVWKTESVQNSATGCYKGYH